MARLIDASDISGALPSWQSPITGSFFSGDQANIQRLGDRAFIGSACDQDGAAVPAQRTWVGLEANGYLTYFDTRSTYENISSIGGVAYAGGTRASDGPAGLSNVPIVYAALAKNDIVDATAGNRIAAWGWYGLAVREPDSGAAIAGATQVGETHIVNRGGVVDVNPYTTAGMTSGVTYNWIFGAGGEYSESGVSCNPVSACINIASGNGATFRKGIKFTANALDGCDGTTGVGIACAFAKGHQINWYYSGSETAVGMAIRSDCADLTYATKMVGTDSGLRFYDQFDNTITRLLQDTSLTSAANHNYLILRNIKATTGNPSIQATGSDASIGVDIVGQFRAQHNFYNMAKTRLMARFADVGSLTTSSSNILIFNAHDTGSNPYIKAGGVDTNSSVAVEGKGTGGFIARDGAAAKKIEVNTTGLGFFNATPVAKPTLPAELSTGGSETNENIAAMCNAIRTALINYGLAA